MKYAEIEGMTEKEIEETMRETEMELIKLNSQAATGTPPENPGRIKKLRRTMARLKTALRNNE